MAKANQYNITLESVDHFRAYGMRRLHGFDLFTAGRRRVFRCDIWATKDGRLLTRFHCPSESDYDESHEIRGMTVSDLTETDVNSRATESDDVWPLWVPQCVRDGWHLWFTSVI
jgi:hypothetical protein